MTVIPLPTPAYQYGQVVGRVVHAIADTASDADALPEARPAQGKVTFKPRETLRVVTSPDADRAFVTHEPVVADLDTNGRIIDAEGRDGIWLVTGTYDVSFQVTRPGAPKLNPLVIEVTPEHGGGEPLDLTEGVSYTPPSGIAVQTLQVPGGGTTGDMLVKGSGGSMTWVPAPELTADDVEALNTTVTSKVTRGDLVVSASDFASYTYPIQEAINAARAETSATDSSRGAQVLIPSRRRWLTDQPIILPRSGATPTKAIKLVGDGDRQTRIEGTSGFPAGRGIIEWEATIDRAFHQNISGLQIVLPEVAGVKAIWYKRQSLGTDLVDFNNERAQLFMRDVLIESHNGYHPVLIRLEGQFFACDFKNVIASTRVSSNQPGTSYPVTTDYDGCLFEFDSDLYGYALDNDITGLSYSRIDDCRGGVRRGGKNQLIKGRAKNVAITGGFNDGSRYSPGIELRNSFNVRVTEHQNEGRSAAQIRFTDSVGITLEGIFPSTQNPYFPDWAASTSYALNAGVVRPGWRSATSGTPANINWYKATTAGTSGSTEPPWPATVGATVVDGGVTWECMGPSIDDAIVFDNCDDIAIRDLRSTSQKPAFTPLGVNVLSFRNGCSNVRVDGTVPGDPVDEVDWSGVLSGVGRLWSARNDVFRTLGADPYAISPIPSSVFIPADQFTLSSGAPALTVINNAPGWALDAAADEYVRAVASIPSTWTSVNLEFAWFNAGAGTGNVALRGRVGLIGTSVVSNGSSQESVVAAGAQNAMTRTTVNSSGFSVSTPTLPVLLEVGRRGSAGTDTLANDIHLIGVKITAAV